MAAERTLMAERIYRYGWAFDEREPTLLADCFTDDARWEARVAGETVIGPFDGRAAIVEFMKGFWERQDDQRRHMISNVIVDAQTEDEARVLTYHLLASARGGAPVPVTCGFYRLLMQKQDGVWRIHRLLAGYDVRF
jgi:SnoaL-like protein